MSLTRFLFFIATLMLMQVHPCAATTTDYQSVPDSIRKIINIPAEPSVVPSPDGEMLLFAEYGQLPAVEDLARPTVGLAGIVIDAARNSRRPLNLAVSLYTIDMESGERKTVTGLPKEAGFSHVTWSPDSEHIAFAVYEEGGVTLWVADADTMQAQRIAGLKLNDILGAPYVWHPDGDLLLTLAVPAEQGPRPEVAKHKFGPVIQDSTGFARAARTYQNLLQSAYDVALFEYLAASVIAQVSTDGEIKTLGEPSLYSSLSPSPNGKYLLTETIRRPYSYILPVSRFPYRVEVLDMQGASVRLIDELELANAVPAGRWNVRTGAREAAWNPAEPAELWWVTARDGGKASANATIRDELFVLNAPFTDEPRSVFRMPMRFENVYWGGDAVFAAGVDTQSGKKYGWMLEEEMQEPIRLATGSFMPLVESADGAFRKYRLMPDEKGIYLADKRQGALLGYDIRTESKKILWTGDESVKESVIRPLEDDKEFLVRSESFTSPPNYYIRTKGNKNVRAVTAFEHPVPSLLKVQKKRLEYTRADGVRLAGDLYLPPEYTVEDGPLPTLIWIYPREYKNKAAAEKALEKENSFMPLGRTSRMFWPLMGYALLDSPAMPIIGSNGTQPNDTFLKQLEMNAEAAVSELVRTGVARADNIAVGGHSYGAFATANLLTHTSLFAAGIARSGAYNRSLTPFGFQHEHRSLWKNPELYKNMSPFFHISKINSPVLIIHGDHDQNAGTHPEQSVRLHQALVGLGKTSRLVLLPYEGHSYYGQESVMHAIWEMTRWLDSHLEPLKEQPQSAGSEPVNAQPDTTIQPHAAPVQVEKPKPARVEPQAEENAEHRSVQPERPAQAEKTEHAANATQTY
ncbi:S9 family peptidase [Oleidesulfovibrio sp.]|uniref:S9 family peptidase n=1 Tax=Oleidesulfovibrio sp. TaxID=2909707 RepID=UPI003A890D43